MREVDHIAGSPAAETVIIGVVQLHAGGVVLVEGAPGHPGGRDRQAVQGRGLPHSNGGFDSLKKIHLHLAILIGWWHKALTMCLSG